MIGSILNAILGTKTEKEDGQGNGVGSLLVVGVILFVLLGGLKLLQKPEDEDCTETETDC